MKAWCQDKDKRVKGEGATLRSFKTAKKSIWMRSMNNRRTVGTFAFEMRPLTEQYTRNLLKGKARHQERSRAKE